MASLGWTALPRRRAAKRSRLDRIRCRAPLRPSSARRPGRSLGRLLAALSVAGCAIGVAACEPHPTLYGDAAAAELHEIKVEAGDRFEIDRRPVRLADAVTPQPAPDARCRAEAMIAAHAAEVVRSALTGARHLEVQATPGREGLGLVNIDGLDLGQTLIHQNLAVARGAAAMDWCSPTRTSG